MIEEHLKKIRSEVDEKDNESKIGWNFLYQTIRAESTAHDFPCAAARSAANKSLNRYRDVSPFDHSRVVLSKGNSDYINASLVQVSRAGRRYILTQGPLPHTAGHFWLMIWEQNSKAILMLNKIIEKNQIKCHQYWPLGAINSDNDVMEFHDDVELRVRYISEEQSRNFVVRKLRIEDLRTSESREVFQFHYTTWPDFGVPSTARTFLHFLQVVRDYGVLNANVGPPVVHCSAGIGRSGTFCLVDSCLLMMEEGLTVNVKDVLMDMRKFRMGLIQTPDQLRFSYLAILEGLQQLAEGKKRFMSDENENGDVEVIEVDDKPAPPKRIESLPNKLQEVQEELYRRLIQGSLAGMETVDRPLPDIPTSSSDDDSSEDSLIDDELDDDTPSKSESSKDELIPSEIINVNVHESQINHVAENNKIEEPEPATITETITNGGVAGEEASLRRRAKNEALREKIKEIKAHQKESEAVQGFYRLFPDKKYLYIFIASVSVAFAAYYFKSPKPKRRKESKEDEDVNIGDGENVGEEECDNDVELPTVTPDEDDEQATTEFVDDKE